MEDDQGPDDDHPRREVVIIFAVFFDGGLAPLSLLLGWLLGHGPLETFRWNWDGVFWGVAATVPMILVTLAMMRWPVGPLKWFKEICDNEVVPLLEGSSWSEIALLSLATSVGEEMLCRGVLQASLSSWLGVPWGLGLASLLTGVLHLISVQYMMMEVLLAVCLGAVWVLSGNLLTVVVAHGLYSFAALSYLLQIRPRGGISSMSE